jgi:hypothetical protein
MPAKNASQHPDSSPGRLGHVPRRSLFLAVWSKTHAWERTKYNRQYDEEKN